jgi:D-serine dehydratase
VKNKKLPVTVTVRVTGTNARECSCDCPYYYYYDEEDSCRLFLTKGEVATRLRRTAYYGGQVLRSRRCLKVAGR